MVKLSIIIPHYNSFNFLKKMLESIPDEEWIKIIVVDDNSDQDIDQLKLIYNHVNFFRVPKGKKGAGAARNVGIKNAEGDYVLFADADDYFLENSFELIRNKINSEFDIVFFNPTSYNINTNTEGVRHKRYSYIIDDYIKNENKDILYKFHVPWSKLISLKLIKHNNIGFEEVLASNDVNFSLRISFYSEKIFCVKEVIYCVTESNNSLTKQIKEEVLDSRFGAFARYNDFLRENNLKHLQGAMSGHLWNTRHFGIYKFL